jgi:hypothetical protein
MRMGNACLSLVGWSISWCVDYGNDNEKLSDLSEQTPYLTSTLQPPANLVDPNLVLEYPISTVNKAKKRMEEDMDVDETGTPGPSTRESSGSRVMRMKTGEVKWWTTGIEVDKEGARERLYNWIDAGGEAVSIQATALCF